MTNKRGNSRFPSGMTNEEMSDMVDLGFHELGSERFGGGGGCLEGVAGQVGG